MSIRVRIKSINPTKWTKLIWATFALYFLVIKLGVQTENLQGWNTGSRMAKLFVELNIYQLRSDFISSIVFLLCFVFSILLFTIPVNSAKRKKSVKTGILSLLFSLFLVIGNFAVYGDRIFSGNWSPGKILAFVIGIPGLYFLINQGLTILLNRLADINLVNDAASSLQSSRWDYRKIIPSVDDRHSLMRIWLFFIVCYFPYYLLYFPGIISPDAFQQFSQVLGTAKYVDDHPMFHTFLILVSKQLVSLVSSSNTLAFGMYTLLQYMFVTFTYSYTINWLLDKGFNRKFLSVLALFLALFPMHAYNAMYVTKDILSAVSLSLLTILLVDFVQGKYRAFSQYLGFSALFVFTGLVRNHVYYILIAFGLFMLVYFLVRKTNKMWKEISAIAICLLLLLSKGFVYNQLGVTSRTTTEALSVPLQQIARVVYLSGDVPESVQDETNYYFPSDYIKENYSPYLSDKVKGYVNAKGYDQEVIARIWKTLLEKNLAIFLDSFILSNFGYWYPQYNVSAVDSSASDSFFRENQVKKIFPNQVRDIVQSLMQLIQFLPIINLSASIGFMAILMILSIKLSLVRKQRFELMMCYFPILITYISLLLGSPGSGTYRYAYFLFTSLPIFASFPFIVTTD